MGRMHLFITGTDTGVGKTWVTAGLAAVLQNRHRRRVDLWKPVQSGVAADAHEADSNLLMRAIGMNPSTPGNGCGTVPSAVAGQIRASRPVATYTFVEPLAPWMAAERSGQTIDVDELVAEGHDRMAETEDVLLVEGAGGWFVPLTAESTVGDLAQQLGMPVLVVARPGLGTVNHTLLTIHAVRSAGLHVAGVVLNGCTDCADPAVLENARMIEHFGAVPVIGLLPWMSFGTDSSQILDGSEEGLERRGMSPQEPFPMGKRRTAKPCNTDPIGAVSHLESAREAEQDGADFDAKNPDPDWQKWAETVERHLDVSKLMERWER